MSGLFLAGAFLLLIAVPLLWWALAAESDDWDGVAIEDQPVDQRQAFLGRSAQERVVHPAIVRVGDRLAAMSPQGIVEGTNRRIMLAGLQGRTYVQQILFYKLAGLLVGSGVGVLALLRGAGLPSLIVAVVAVFAGFRAPDILLDGKVRRRQTEFERDIADHLDQMTICVEAGLGFDAAMIRVASSNRTPMAQEFGRTLQDIRLGMPRSEALAALAERTDIPDVRLVVRTLRQADRSGVAISRILRVQADEIREKRRQRAEEAAMKLPVKLIFPLILCILPALFAVVIGPAVISIVSNGGVAGG